jgi:hypothetical protein
MADARELLQSFTMNAKQGRCLCIVEQRFEL